MRADIPEIVSRVEWKISWYDIKTAIEEAFYAELGESEVVRVDVYENPHGFSGTVWLKSPADDGVKNLARELTKEFRKKDIRVGFLLQEEKQMMKTPGKPDTSVEPAESRTQADALANED